ncbi:MAG TPA: hypothetical protein VF072_11805, partial [Thermoleophilaceae bacterium]
QPSSPDRGVSAEAASGGFLASAAAAVESFFLDSAEPEAAAEGTGPVEIRPVVCVFGLARGCGVTVVARALAAELALRDPARTAVVCSDDRPAGLPLATHAASRLARNLEDIPTAHPRALGGLCLASGDPQRLVQTARHHAPVVIDAGSEQLGGAPAALADRAVIVTGRDVEPALARVASQCIARVGPPPVVVLNRAPHDQPGLFALPNSALGARLALGGREPRGELGRAIAELADLLEDEP